jgi:hypothetical protein
MIGTEGHLCLKGENLAVFGNKTEVYLVEHVRAKQKVRHRASHVWCGQQLGVLAPPKVLDILARVRVQFRAKSQRKKRNVRVLHTLRLGERAQVFEKTRFDVCTLLETVEFADEILHWVYEHSWQTHVQLFLFREDSNASLVGKKINQAKRSCFTRERERDRKEKKKKEKWYHNLCVASRLFSFVF